MRRSRAYAILGAVLIVVIVGLTYRSIYPVGGVRLAVSTPIGENGELHYRIWTVAPNGSLILLTSGTAHTYITLSSSVVRRVQSTARRLNSSSGILFVDTWVKRGDEVYSMPVQSFEIKDNERWFVPKKVRISLFNPLKVEKGSALEWRTLDRTLLHDVKVPVMIVQKNSNVSLVVNLAINSYSNYVGPKVTVVYANESARNVSDVKINVLNSAFTGTYHIGMGAEMKKGPHWVAEGVYMNLLVIKQEEYVCKGTVCQPDGLLRYLVIPLGMRYTGSNPMIVNVWREEGSGNWWKSTRYPPRGITLTPALGVFVGDLRNPTMLYDIYRKPWSSDNMTMYAVGVATPAGYELRNKLNWLPGWFSSIPVVLGNSIAGSMYELQETNETAKVYGTETAFKIRVKTSPTNGSTVTTMPFGYYFYVVPVKP